MTFYTKKYSQNFSIPPTPFLAFPNSTSLPPFTSHNDYPRQSAEKHCYQFRISKLFNDNSDLKNIFHGRKKFQLTVAALCPKWQQYSTLTSDKIQTQYH